jgi:hypothetical protein
LLFSGELNGEFVALEAKTGAGLALLLGQQITAQPVTYTVKGSSVAIASASDASASGFSNPGRAAK